MADELRQKKGSDLPIADTLGDNDSLFGIQAGVTKRFPGAVLKKIASYGTFVSTGFQNLQKDIDAVSAFGGGLLACPAGNYPGNIVLKPGVIVKGSGRKSVIVGDSSSAHIVSGPDFDSLTGTNNYSDGTPHNLGLIDFVVQGSSQTTGTQNGVSVYGYALYFKGVYVANVPGKGFQFEWGQYGEAKFGMESNFEDLKVDRCGEHGILHKGPHDSSFTNCVVIDAGQKADNTYMGFYSTGYANSRSTNTHVWHRSGATNRVAYAIWADGGCEFVSCHAEGGRRQLYLGGGCKWYTGNVYAPRSVEPQMVFDGVANKVHTSFQSGDATLDITMMELGKNKKCELNEIEISYLLSATATNKPLVKNTNAVGNSLHLKGFGWTGTLATAFSSSPSYADEIVIDQSFPQKVFFRQLPQSGYTIRFDGYGPQSARFGTIPGAAGVSYNVSLSATLAFESTDDATVGYAAMVANVNGLHAVVGKNGGAAKIPFRANPDGYLLAPLLGNFASDSAAATGGVPVNGLYRNGNIIQIRVS